MTATILFVDDESDLEALILQKFRRQIREGLVKVIFAHDGVEALESLELNPQVDMVVSDINMPGMSGLELLPMVRAARPDVPVIMITAYGDVETRRKAIEAGAAGLFTKPIDFPELRGEIGRRLDAATGPP